MTSTERELVARAEAISLAEEMLVSESQVIVRTLRLHSLLVELGVDATSNDLLVFKGIDSEADAWPIGVSPDRLDPNYRARCEREIEDYGKRCLSAVRAGCQAVLSLLSEKQRASGRDGPA